MSDWRLGFRGEILAPGVAGNVLREPTRGGNMRRRTLVAVLATLVLGLFAVPASAQSNGGGKSGDAPGQARAAANCEHVWGELQADLVAGGGPKSKPVASIDATSGPTNCDHFWQSEGVIGNG
jgi:hypothetical protein